VEEIIDQIYEAGAVPELWPEVLERVGRLAGTPGAVLFSLRGADSRWVSSPALREQLEVYFAGGFQQRDDRTQRLLAYQHPGFVTELDVFTPAEWEASPLRRDFCMPNGLGWGVATSIHVPSGDTLILHAERAYAEGPIPRSAVALLDMLRPHLARAALMSARLSFERARGAVAALAALGLAGAVVDRQGRGLAANDLFNGLIPDAIVDTRSGLRLAEHGANALFEQALDSQMEQVATAPRSIPLPARGERPAMIVHVLPVPGAAADVFSGAAAVVLVTTIEPKLVPTATVIQGLFDLTPAEAKIARAVGQGLTIEQAAAAAGTSRETVRTQLRAVFDKTGVHRQAELVGLLHGSIIRTPGI